MACRCPPSCAPTYPCRLNARPGGRVARCGCCRRRHPIPLSFLLVATRGPLPFPVRRGEEGQEWGGGGGLPRQQHATAAAGGPQRAAAPPPHPFPHESGTGDRGRRHQPCVCRHDRRGRRRLRRRCLCHCRRDYHRRRRHHRRRRLRCCCCHCRRRCDHRRRHIRHRHRCYCWCRHHRRRYRRSCHCCCRCRCRRCSCRRRLRYRCRKQAPCLPAVADPSPLRVKVREGQGWLPGEAARRFGRLGGPLGGRCTLRCHDWQPSYGQVSGRQRVRARVVGGVDMLAEGACGF